jgi:hypothetical protein
VVDINSAYVVWGFKNRYHTHSHIHEAFYRTLKGMGKRVEWLDSGDNLAGRDLSDTTFITEHEAAKDGMPLSKENFYFIHGANNDAACQQRLEGYNWLGWNVYLDNPPGVDSEQNKTTWNYKPCDSPLVWLDDEMPYWPACKRFDMRWATDQLPYEIEWHKPRVALHLKGNRINWVGSVWHVNDVELSNFKRAAWENGITFQPVGAGQRGVVSIEENIRLVRESYMAPAISGSHHNVEGYVPCRIFKNISYGQMGITNNPFTQKLFGNRLIFNTDCYKLFFDARKALASVDLSQIHELMDFVADKHTYINRIKGMLKAGGMALGI